MVDGNGVLHHRGFGLASHFGVLANIPTIGIGKSFLCVDKMTINDSKKWTGELLKAGDYKLLIGESQTVWGAVLRGTQKANAGVFVSIGHRVCLKTALAVAFRVCFHRIPEPVRQADLLSRDFVKDNWEDQKKPFKTQKTKQDKTKQDKTHLETK